MGTKRDLEKRGQQFAAEFSAALGIEEKELKYAEYANDPVGFARDVLGIGILTQEQVAILHSIRDKSDTNVQAAHGVGKSFICAIAVIWWVFAVGGLAISTAPTRHQVEEILWSEIRKLYDRNKDRLGGHRTELTLKLSETARAYGFTSRNYDSNSFHGKHAAKLLLIQDEACGITQEIDDGFEGCLTGSLNRGVRIGNPIVPNTPFERACKRRNLRIAVWSHPNTIWAYEQSEDGIYRLKPEVAAKILKPLVERQDDPILPQEQWPADLPRDVIPGAVSINWIEKIRAKIKSGGSTEEQSAFWQSRIEGLFPLDATESVIPRSMFLAARQRYDNDPDYWDGLAALKPVRLGLDVGDGGDPHAKARWQGPVLYAVATKDGQGDGLDTGRAAEWVAADLRQYPGSSVAVDRGGPGAGTYNDLKRARCKASGVHWGAGAKDPKQYLNCKAEDFWNLREALRLQEVAIAPLGEIEDEVMEDLAGTYWEETVQGKIRIEDKGKTRKRLHRSPNAGDAVVLGLRKGKDLSWIGKS